MGEWKKAFDKITDCFSCADGGLQFVKMKSLIEEMARQADAGDEPARMVMDVMNKFAKLIDAADAIQMKKSDTR